MRTAPVLMVVGALALGACTTSVPGSPRAADGAVASSPAGPVPEGLESFYGQTLSWGPCAPFATTAADRQSFGNETFECARAQVPLDYAEPTSTKASIALLRVPATGDRTGSLLVNPGGPGGSGMSLAASLAETVATTPIGARFDLVGFDPRGVGASQPAVDCVTDAEADADRMDLDVDTSPAGIAQTEQEEKDYAALCAKRVGPDVLEHVGTREVAQDLDVLRAVLGDEKLNYLGYSYGTRIGTSYAEQFPGNVRALVLDGALDPTADPVAELVRQGEGFQGAFEAYATDCATEPACPLGPDPARATQRYRTLVNALIDTPVPTAGPRQLGYNDATIGTIQALYSPQLWPLLTRGLTELARGRGDTLLQLADIYNGRDPDGSYANSDDAFTAVRCVDSPPITDRAETAEAEAKYREVAPFLDDGRGTGGAALDVCAFWPVPPTGEPHAVNAAGLPLTVVVSTTGDPATPYQAGVDLARQLDARLITFTGDQHTVVLDGRACVDDAVAAYLIDLTPPPSGLTC